MAQCHTEGRKHPSAMDFYVSALHTKLYNSNRDVGKYPHWPRYINADSTDYFRSSQSFHEEPNTDSRHSLFSGKFCESTRGVDPNREGKSLRNQSCPVPRKAFQKQSTDTKLFESVNIPSNGTTVPIKCLTNLDNGVCIDKEIKSFQPKAFPSNGILSGSMGNRGSCVSSGDANVMSVCNNSTLNFISDQANNLPRIHKSAEQGVALASKVSLSTNNWDTGSRLSKSGEQVTSKCKLNAGNVKHSLNGGLIVGSQKVGGYGSADSSSSNGGSTSAINEGGMWSSASSNGSSDFSGPIKGSFTAKDSSRKCSSSNGGSSDGGSPMPKDVFNKSSSNGYSSGDLSSMSIAGPIANNGGRRLSTCSILSSKDNSTLASGRGMGNILVNGNNKSSIKVACNDLKLGNCLAKKSDELVTLNCSSNMRGPSVNDGSLNHNLGNLCPGYWTSALSSGNILSHGTTMKINSKPGEVCELVDPEDIKNAGNEQYKMGHFSEAVALYDKSIAIRPNHPPYRSNRAAALSGLGKLGEAVQECEEAIKLDPSYARAHQRAGYLYLRLGLIESAKRHFQSALLQDDSRDMQAVQTVERHISRCIEARKAGDWKSVLQESNDTVVAGADSAPQVLGYKSEALLKLHKPEEAGVVCAEAQRQESSLHKLGLAPPDAFPHMLRARIEMYLGRFEGAIRAAEFSVKVDPRNPETVGLLKKARAVGQTRTSGNELFKNGRFFEACAVYGEGLESDPANAVLLCNRAACRSKLGQWEKAIEDCDAALVAQPNYTKAIMRRAHCSTKLERWGDALRDYEVLRVEMPNDMEVAQGHFDVQLAIKKLKGEDIYKMKIGGCIEAVSDKDQLREVVTTPGLSVVQFITRLSDGCGRISPFVDQMCKRYPCVYFAKVDVDDNPDIAKTEVVTFVPTFKIFKNGQKVKELLGPSEQDLEYTVKHYSL